MPAPRQWPSVLSCLLFASQAHAAGPGPGNPAGNRVEAVRATSPIVLDGALDEATWQAAPPLRAFYEVFPGDHAVPPVRTEVRYAFDAQALYVAVHAYDPEPARIRRPFVRRDRVRAGQDYVQVFIDPFNARRSSQLFRINVRGDQTDGVTNEASGLEDDTPDFPFDVATRVVGDGWQAELRIPFSSLRFRAGSHAPWAIMAYRGWPRSQNTQIASGPLTRDGTCFLCYATTVTGIETPADARSLIVTPYVAPSVQRTRAGGSHADTHDMEAGVDVKWVPAGGWVIDATVHPDFSELEADAPQITGNARHATSIPEKRPFFLESADLLQTPLPIIYTRTIADPDLGARATRRGESLDGTAWYVRDGSGAVVLLPGPFSTGAHALATPTDVLFGRARWNAGKVALAMDVSDRRGGGYRNSVFGADATWFAGGNDIVTAQVLGSRTRDPDAGQRAADGSAAYLGWSHGSSILPWLLHASRIGRGFRADNGYLPSADVQELYLQAGPRFFDVGIFNEVQPMLEATRQTVASTGQSIDRWIAPEVYFAAPRNAYGTIAWHGNERVRPSADAPESRTRFLRFEAAISPLPHWTKLRLTGDAGRLMDYGSGHTADGHVATLQTLQWLGDHLEIEVVLSRLHMRARRDVTAVDLRQEAEALTLVYHRTAAESWRVQWTHDRYRRREPFRDGDEAQSLALVYARRPDWRNNLFAGINLGRHLPFADQARAPRIDTQRLFVKWSHAFGG